MKILIAGWFSFEQMGATAGDLYSKDILAGWLKRANISYDVALASPFTDGVRWQSLTPQHYSHVIFVCGPFGNGWPVTEFLEHFTGVKLVGVNLSMLQNLDEWNPFDLLLERDSSRRHHPDLVFLSDQPRVPVVGLILVEPQKEYKKKARHQEANEAILKLLKGQPAAVVPIDTRLDVPNHGGLKTAPEIETLIARMDAVITTRLHGLVLALKNHVPVLAVDAISGGAKLAAQAQVIGWPNLLIIDEATDEKLLRGYQYCFTQEAREKTAFCKSSALAQLNSHEQTLIEFLRNSEAE